MKICQTLYEAGLITYMRTDSTKYSKEFIETAKEHITKHMVRNMYMKQLILYQMVQEKIE